jgi:hypothetical protein
VTLLLLLICSRRLCVCVCVCVRVYTCLFFVIFYVKKHAIYKKSYFYLLLLNNYTLYSMLLNLGFPIWCWIRVVRGNPCFNKLSSASECVGLYPSLNFRCFQQLFLLVLSSPPLSIRFGSFETNTHTHTICFVIVS